MKRSLLRGSALFALWLSVTTGLSYAAYTYRDDIKDEYTIARVEISSFKVDTLDKFADMKNDTSDYINGKIAAANSSIENSRTAATVFFKTQTDKLKDVADKILDVPEPKIANVNPRGMPNGFINASYDYAPPPPQPLTLSEIKKRQEEDRYARIVPAAGTMAEPLWTPEEPSLNVEAVLVPRQITVISSSQDGRIANIPVNHGDTFKKGDLLVSYDCSSLRAEADIAKYEKTYTEKRLKGSDSLFKLDIISDLDRAGAQIEDQKATVKDALYQSRLKDCDIRSEFDGRVTNRLANPGEYTRTDRVLLEVASNEALQAEFLVPSKWLRWINIGAPVSIIIGETEKTYTAKISRIHGEVDPVSQSVQVIATLDNYNDPLLPGMSGKATVDINDIRGAGVQGYLEVSAPADMR